MNTKLLLVAAAFSVSTAMADDTPAIRTNQVGYLPSQEKVIVFDGTTYLGHRLSLNGTVVGSLALGRGLTFDDKLVENLETLFKVMS